MNSLLIINFLRRDPQDLPETQEVQAEMAPQ